MRDCVQKLKEKEYSEVLFELMTRVRDSLENPQTPNPKEDTLIVDVKYDSDLPLLKSDTIKATIWNGVGSHQSMSSQEFSCYHLLEELTIGNDCFQHVLSFVLEDMHHLKTVKIGKNCFCKPAVDGMYQIRSISFEVKNCEVLTSVKIEDDSFVDMVKVTFESELYMK